MSFKGGWFLTVLICLATITLAKELQGPMIKIYYDNVSLKEGVKPAWGFAALVDDGKNKILFDTGGKPEILLANMKAMKIAPQAVTDVFISHNHWDHTGGLFSFLSRNSKVNVYLPAAFSETYQREVIASGAKCSRIKNFTAIAKNIYSSGELGEAIKEQSLIVDTPKGLVIVTGCSHPGIVNIVHHCRELLKKDIYFVVGGFHLYDLSDSEIKKIIKELKSLGVKKIAPCHCTGKKTIALFREEFGDGFVEVGAGSEISD